MRSNIKIKRSNQQMTYYHFFAFFIFIARMSLCMHACVCVYKMYVYMHECIHVCDIFHNISRLHLWPFLSPLFEFLLPTCSKCSLWVTPFFLRFPTSNIVHIKQMCSCGWDQWENSKLIIFIQG